MIPQFQLSIFENRIFKEVEKFYKELPPFPSDSPIDVD
jgi:hypothetical protein